MYSSGYILRSYLQAESTVWRYGRWLGRGDPLEARSEVKPFLSIPAPGLAVPQM